MWNKHRHIFSSSAGPGEDAIQAHLDGADAAIELHDFAVKLQGVQLLQIQSLTIRRRQLVHLQGSNGAGKTTFLRALVGELPTAGTIRICGGLPGTVQARQSMIYVPTDTFLPEDLQVQEYLRFMASAWAVPEQPLFSLAERMGLGSWLAAWPGVLSRGTRQKVALAAALGLSRPITLLDEPFGTLDQPSREVLLQAIEQRCQQGGTVLSTTHGGELSSLRPVVLELRGGSVIELSPACSLA